MQRVNTCTHAHTHTQTHTHIETVTRDVCAMARGVGPKQITPLTEQFINKYLDMHMHAHLWFHILLVLFSLIIAHATVNQHQHQQQQLSYCNCTRGKYKLHLIAVKSRVSPFKYIYQKHRIYESTHTIYACHMPPDIHIRLPQKMPFAKMKQCRDLAVIICFHSANS